jgi:hypothetical protein
MAGKLPASAMTILGTADTSVSSSRMRRRTARFQMRRFDQPQERGLGQPVRVAGKASLRILPTPSVSFTDVRVRRTWSVTGHALYFRARA